MLTLLHCSDPASPGVFTEHFAIYLLSDPSITTSEAMQMSLSALPLRNEPWLSIDDIEKYQIPSHTIYLDSSFAALFQDDTTALFRTDIEMPFVVIGCDARVYIGTFHHVNSQLKALVPSIWGRGSNTWYPERLKLRIFPPSKSVSQNYIDKRGDGRILHGLKLRNKLYQVDDSGNETNVVY
ncbi:hypothetical protein ACFL6L_02815 [candidate division KSB1 bacterium]